MACGESIETDLERRTAALERAIWQLGSRVTHREQPCLFDGINPETNPVMGLACPCPRCSPR
jgi:hypothetical protein